MRQRLTLTLWLLMALTATATAEDDGTVLWGNVVYDRRWSQTDYHTGIYAFRAQTKPGLQQMSPAGLQLQANGGGIFNQDETVYYCFNYYTDDGLLYATMTSYDADDWTVIATEEIDSYRMLPVGFTRNPENGRVYGLFRNDQGDGYELGVMNFSRFTRTTIGAVQEDLFGIAYSVRDNLIYGIDSRGDLYSYSPVDARSTKIGATGVKPGDFLCGVEMDNRTNQLYWTPFFQSALTGAFSSGLYVVDVATAEARKVCDFEGDNEVIQLYVPNPPCADDAPDYVTDLLLDFPQGSTTGVVSFQMPAQTYGGAALEGDLSWAIAANGKVVGEGQAAKGEAVTATVSVPNGKTRIEVYARNNVGDGAKAKQKMWIGIDTPQAVANLQASKGGQDDCNLVLTWDAVPTTGTNGGYLDPERLVYRVKNLTTGAERTVSEPRYEETVSPDEWTCYQFTVTAVCGDQQGASATSERLRAGRGMAVPRCFDFETINQFYLFDVIDHNADEATWMPYRDVDDNNNKSAGYIFGVIDADDYLLTPPFRLQTGRRYRFQFKYKSHIYYYKQLMEVTWGRRADDPLAYTDSIMPLTEFNDKDYATWQRDITVSASGDYRFAFHALSEMGREVIEVDSVCIYELMATSVPNSVSNLSVTALPQGALGATIGFTLPTLTLGGDALTAIDHATLLRDGQPIHTFNDITPGEQLNHTDADAMLTTDYHLYAIDVYGADLMAGPTARRRVWIGHDTPATPGGIAVEDLGQELRLTWDAADGTGEHGGYCDPLSVSYSISETVFTDAQHAETRLLAEGLTANSFTTSISHEGEQEARSYSVTATDAAGHRSRAAESTSVVAGQPYALPFVEHFATTGFDYDMWSNAYVIDQFLSWFTTAGYGDGALFCNYSFGYLDKVLTSGLIDMSQAVSPMLSLRLSVDQPTQGKMRIEVGRDNGPFQPVDVISFEQSDGGDEESFVHTTDLSDFADARFIRLRIVVGDAPSSDHAKIYLWEVSVRNQHEHNLAATALTAPETFIAGSAKPVNLTVENVGALPTADGDATALILADGQPVASMPLTALQPMMPQTVAIPVVLSAAQETAQLTARIDYAADGDMSDNQTGPLAVSIIVQQYPAPRSLKATAGSDDSVNLSWQEPDLTHTDELVEQVCDDAEAYDNGVIDYFGRWTSFDEDCGHTYALSGVADYDNRGAQMACQVLDMSAQRYADMTMLPHSGRQVFAFWAAVPDDVVFDLRGFSSDYLISPRLTGREQTLTFWARCAVPMEPDSFMVKVSTTGDAVPDFTRTLLASGVKSEWQQFSVTLPAGSTHFAIHRYSKDRFCLMMDDFRFQAQAPDLTLVGYNIYRDGRWAASVESTALNVSGQEGSGSYQVSAIYDTEAGLVESPLSEPVAIGTAGIMETAKSKMTSDNAVYDLQGRLIMHDEDCIKHKSQILIRNHKKVINQ